MLFSVFEDFMTVQVEELSSTYFQTYISSMGGEILVEIT